MAQPCRAKTVLWATKSGSQMWRCLVFFAGVSYGRALSRSGFLLFQRSIDCWVGADFVVAAVGPAPDREILDIDSRHAALAHYDFAKDVTIDRHGGAEQ